MSASLRCATVKMGPLAQTLLPLPALSTLRAAHPRWRLEYWVPQAHVAVVELVKGLDYVGVGDQIGDEASAGAWRERIDASDIAISWSLLDDSVTPHVIASGARRRYAVQDNGSAADARWAKYVDFVARCELAGGLAWPEVAPPQQELERIVVGLQDTCAAAECTTSSELIALMPGSALPVGTWDARTFARLATLCREHRYGEPILLGYSWQRDALKAIACLVSPWIPVVTLGSARALVILLTLLQAAITVEGEFGYMAALAGIPTRTLHDRLRPDIWAAWGPWTSALSVRVDAPPELSASPERIVESLAKSTCIKP